MKTIISLLLCASTVYSVNLDYIDQYKQEMMVDIDNQTEAQQKIYIENSIKTQQEING